MSSIEHSHKAAISDIQWIPDHMEVSLHVAAISCAVLSIEQSHKAAIIDIQWIPDHMVVRYHVAAILSVLRR